MFLERIVRPIALPKIIEEDHNSFSFWYGIGRFRSNYILFTARATSTTTVLSCSDTWNLAAVSYAARFHSNLVPFTFIAACVTRDSLDILFDDHVIVLRNAIITSFLFSFYSIPCTGNSQKLFYHFHWTITFVQHHWGHFRLNTETLVVQSSGGFRISQRRGRQPQRGRCQPITLANFSQKLHENEKK